MYYRLGPGEDVERILDSEASALADLHGLDAGLLRVILEQTAQLSFEAGSLQRIVKFSPSLRNALQALDGNQAISLFSESDVNDLSGRERIAAYLLNQAHLYTLDELAHLINLFTEHVKSTRGQIVGCPYESPFGPSPWLSEYGRLIYPRIDKRDEVSLTTDLWPDRLSQQDLTRIYRERSNLLDAKLEVLNVVREQLAHHTASGSIRDCCLYAITQHISADQVRFWIMVDRSVSNYDILTGSLIHAGQPRNIVGGLSDTLQLVGHCDQEMQVGLHCQVRDILGSILVYSDSGDITPSYRDYYNLIASGNKSVIDSAIEHFRTLRATHNACNQEYHSAVSSWLAEDFGISTPMPLSIEELDRIQRDYDTQNANESFALGSFTDLFDDIDPEGDNQNIGGYIGVTISSMPSISQQGFWHSPNYDTVNLNGIFYYLTPRQAQVVQLLHTQHNAGVPSITQDYIVVEVSDGIKTRMRDIFKSRPEAYKALIKRVDTKRYALNI